MPLLKPFSSVNLWKADIKKKKQTNASLNGFSIQDLDFQKFHLILFKLVMVFLVLSPAGCGN